jgi:membrane associated rhomboid family serine protease
MKATNVLIALCALVYIGELATGGPDSGRLVQAGQLYGPSVLVAHQWYRLATYGFLHASWLHIGLNMFALYQLGTFVEYVIGAPRMLALYFISLVGSGFAIVLFSYNEPTIGASGAIFGLFGALIAIGIRMGTRGRRLIFETLPIIAINLIFTFSVPSISKAGHVGGLVIGLVAGLIVVMLPRRLQPEPVVAAEEAQDVAHEAAQEAAQETAP